MITEGKDVLDAVIAGVNLCELDPEDTSVGYGGLPNAEGVVQLDASCMHGPKKRAGAVACIEGVRTPSLVAQKVMSDTDHHLLVGRDAQRFARNLGFKIEDDLNTDRSRAAWLSGSGAPIQPATSIPRNARRRCAAEREMMTKAGRSQPLLRHDQLQRHQRQRRDLRRHDDERARLEDSRPCRRLADSARDSTSTARSAPRARPAAARRTFSLASSSSRKCAAARARRTRHGSAARIKANTIEKRLQNARGEPNFNINFYMLNARGEYAGVTMFPGPRGQRFAGVTTARGLKPASRYCRAAPE